MYILLQFVIIIGPILSVNGQFNQAIADLTQSVIPAYGIASKYNEIEDKSSLCRKELLEFRDGVDNKKLWALKVLDSSGIPRPGFVYGNNFWTGSQIQCEESTWREPFLYHKDIMENITKYRNPEEEYPPFDVRYYVANFRHNSTLQYTIELPNKDLLILGLCLPSSCSVEEISLLVQNFIKERKLLYNELYSIGLELEEVRYLKYDFSWLFNGFVIFLGLVLFIIFGLVTCATYYDIFVKSKNVKKSKEHDSEDDQNLSIKSNEEALKLEGTVEKYLLCFSAYRNTKSLFDTSSTPETIGVLNGIRLFSMCWTIVVHSLFFMLDLMDNKGYLYRLVHNIAMQVISNATFTVDTFLFISSFLLAYPYFKQLNKDDGKSENGKKSTKLFKALLGRFMRITPAYMMTILIALGIYSSYKDYSQFTIFENLGGNCANYWWRNLFYINNLFDLKSMCMYWSWYLPNDMQFFLITTIILIYCSKYFYTMMSIFLLLATSSIGWIYYTSYSIEYIPTFDEQYRTAELFYTPPWARIGPYIVGVFSAYIIVSYRNKISLSKPVVIIGWTLCTAIHVFALFGTVDKNMSVFYFAIFISTSRTIWAVAYFWIILACVTNNGGLFDKIMSAKVLIPLSKLTFSAYLLNPIVINSIGIFQDAPIHVEIYTVVLLTAGVMVLVFASAFVLYITVELPFTHLMQLYLKRGRKTYGR